MDPVTPKQEEALRHFLERIRTDFAGRVREVRMLVERPAPADDCQADFGLLVRVGMSAEEARDVDHALDNLACEISLLHDVLLDLHLSHDDEPRDETIWREPTSRSLYS